GTVQKAKTKRFLEHLRQKRGNEANDNNGPDGQALLKKWGVEGEWTGVGTLRLELYKSTIMTISH
uniref:hypothetical protein n=1 Tax=Barnesiella intestinihominis TaxID=487174 RepID=UPI003AB4D67F